MSVFFHIGMGKAGSTYLQQQVFPNLKGITYVDHFRYDNPVSSILLKLYYEQNPWKSNSTEDKEKANLFLTSVENKLFSWESIVGNPYANFHNHFLLADALKEICPEGKIILIIRKQDDYIHSQYMQAVQMGSAFSIRYFMNYSSGNFGTYTPPPWKKANLDVRILNYMNFLDTYIKRFGKENVLVLPFELMKENPKTFIKKIEAFTGSTYSEESSQKLYGIHNKSYSLLSYYIAIITNGITDPTCPSVIRFVRNILSKLFSICTQCSGRKKSSFGLRHVLQNGLDRVFYIRPNLLSSEQRKAILSFHKESNKQLDALYGLELKKYGYY